MMPLLNRHLSPGSLLASSPLVHYLVILFTAAVLCLPCVLTGIPPGHDAPTHVSYQVHFNQQFWNGELYPRWLVHANKGFGSPTFFIQYPLPYFITALLHGISFLPPSAYREARELGIFCFLVIAAAGFAARFWFCKRFSPLVSTLAAIVYMSFPYVLACLYTRAAIGELSTFVWMPLVFAMCDCITPKTIGVLGFFVALLIVSNPLIACLCVPAMILYTLGTGALTPRSVTGHTALLSAGLVLGAGISAVYVLPFVAYSHFFDASQMQANLSGFELGRYFVFLSSSSLAGQKLGVVVLVGALGFTLVVARYTWHLAGNRKIRICMAVVLCLGMLIAIPNLGSKVIRMSGLRVSGFDTPQGFSLGMVITALFTIGLGYLSYCRVAQKGTDSRNPALLAIATGAFVFMLPWSAPIWKAIPALEVIQFPFRSGAILSVAVAGLVAAAINDGFSNGGDIELRPSRRMVTLAILVTLVAGLLAWRIDLNFRHPRTVFLDSNDYVDINYRMYVPPDHIAAFAEMLGTSPGAYHVNPTHVEDEVHATFVRGKGTASVRRVGFREFIVSVDSSGDGLLKLSQLYFPLWKISPARPARNAMIIESSPEGLIELPIPAGKQVLSVVLDRGWPERYGITVTVASLLIACALTGLFRGRRQANADRVLSGP